MLSHRQLGHRSAAITLDMYADLFDTDSRISAASCTTHQPNYRVGLR